MIEYSTCGDTDIYDELDVNYTDIEKAFIESDDTFTRNFFKNDIIANYKSYSIAKLSEIAKEKHPLIKEIIKNILVEKYQFIIDSNPTLYAFYCKKTVQELYGILQDINDDEDDKRALINLAILHLQT